jgi:hypothetical protein
MKTSKIICMLIFALLCVPVAAQQPQQPQPPRYPALEPLDPRTRLEELQMKIGAVIVRGSQRVGFIRGQGRVEVSALEVVDTGGKLRARGISLTIEEAGERSREAVVFVDYEELTGLLDGLESMIRLDRGETQLPNYEVSYRTKGDLIVSVFSTRSGIVRCVVSGGPYAPAAVTFPAEEIGSLRTLITTAKNRLDEIRAK